MDARSVMEIIDALEAADVPVRVNGGWGVDSLIGEQTRPHDDLDVFIPSAYVEASQQALRPLGFELMTDELPQGYVVRDAADRRVDFHPLTMQSDGSGVQHMLDGGTWVMSSAGSQGAGLIGGRAVRCLTPNEAVREHLGYEPGGRTTRTCSCSGTALASSCRPRMTSRRPRGCRPPGMKARQPLRAI